MQPLRLRWNGVIVADLHHAHAGFFPFAGQAKCDVFLDVLALAMVTDEADCLEAGCLEAAGHALEHAGEYFFGHAECSGEAHVAARGIVIAFWNVGDDRRDHRLADFLGDAAGGVRD